MRKQVYLLIVFLLAGVVICHAHAPIDLSGKWSLKQGNGAIENLPIDVPGDVHSALLSAGLILDPHIGTNEFANLWVGREDWILSRSFTLDEKTLSAAAIYLRAEDVDTFCDITINGHHVGTTSNRFRRWEWDVKPYLKAGENVIEGYFHSAEIETEKRSAAYGEPYPMSDVGLVPDINLIRKPTCHGGWDWGPCQMTAGFAGKVELLPVGSARLDYVMCDQDFSLKGRCAVTVNVEVFSPCGGESLLVVCFAGETKKVRVTLKEGKNTLQSKFVVRSPKLWWPNGMGEQPLYDLKVSIDGQTIEKKLALRTIEVINEKDFVYGKEGMSMAFKVNGKPFFAKGADWVPCDIFENRQTRERYRDVLTSAAAANMNMLRHWGGGKFENDDYYELCDSLGLMIWHDFMFSCAVYPSDEAFLGEIEAELNHQLRRLRDYGCIALWCGDNECVGALGWFDCTRANRAFYTASLDKIVRLRGRICAEVDPTRVYWPSSPCAGPGDYQTDNWKEDSKGDMHLWSISKFAEPLEGYYNNRPRFCSEYGHSSFSSLSTIRGFCTSDRQVNPCSVEVESHIKETPRNGGKLGNEIIFERLYLHFQVPRCSDDFFYLSQVEQAMGLKTASEYWRTLEPNCMGTIYWQLNDIWPAGTSWATIEYDGRWKQAHYNAKRFFAPELITSVPLQGDSLAFWAINDTARDKDYIVEIVCWDFAGAVINSKRFDLSLAAGESRSVATCAIDEFVPSSERTKRFLQMNLLNRDGSLAAYNFKIFSEFKYCDLAPAVVSCCAEQEGGLWKVTLSSDAPTFYLWVESDVLGTFSDNSFTLYPGQERTLIFTPKEKVPFEKFVEGLSVKHISATY